MRLAAMFCAITGIALAWLQEWEMTTAFFVMACVWLLFQIEENTRGKGE